MIRTEEVATGRVDGHITHAERPRGGILVLPTITGSTPICKRSRAGTGRGGVYGDDLESLSGRGAAGRPAVGAAARRQAP